MFDFPEPTPPKYEKLKNAHELLLSRQAIRSVLSQLSLPEEVELIATRELINKIEDIIVKL